MSFYTYIGRKGNKIHHIGYDDRGKRFHTEALFKPSIYYEANGATDSISLFGKPLKKKTFDSINDWFQFLGQNKDILEMYSDLDPSYQFLAEKYSEVHYIQNQIRIWFLDIEVLSDEGFPYAHEAKHPIVSIALYDTKRDEYFVMGLKDYTYDPTRLPLNTKKVTYKKCESERELMLKFIELVKALNPDLIIAHNGEGFDFPYIVNRIDNIGLKSTELSPYGKAKSTYKEVEDNFMSKKAEYFTSIDGVSLLDNMALYRKYIQTPRESFSLSNLALEDLGMDKIDYDEYDNLGGLYEKNFEKFTDYNINDVYLMVLLNKKNGYLDIHIRNTYKAKLTNFSEAMSPVRLWDIYIYQELQKQNIQVPPSKRDVSKFTYPGAFVVDPIVGKHKWIATFDLNSLYPSIQMQWNISPEKFVEHLTVEQWLQSLSDNEIDEFIEKSTSEKQIKFLKDLKDMNNLGYAVTPIDRENVDQRMIDHVIPQHPNYIMTSNGYYFQRGELGIIPTLLLENFMERKTIKKSMIPLKKELENLGSDKVIENKLSSMKVNEQGIKIMMNAEYGALANVYFRYCKYELCSSVTMNGQFVIISLINAIKEKLPKIKIIFGDTDSNGFGLEDIVKESCVNMSEKETIQWVISFCNETIQPIIAETYEKLSRYVNAPKNYMKMSREKIISDGIWVAKKHYAFRNVVEDELVLDHAKYGYKGLSCVKSSTPKAIRNEQKRFIETILMDETNISNVMGECKKAIMKLEPTKIAFPKTCNGLAKYSDNEGNPIKGAGSHVKAALVYNKYIRENNLENEYPIIQEGEKIRFIELKQPNRFNSDTFGFINRIPNDPLILEYIDYDKMYFKGFEKPMMEILERINMSGLNSKTTSLEDLF